MCCKSKKAKAKAAEEERARLAEMEASKPRIPVVTFKVMNNCGVVPVAKPADFIQLTPVVQPIPIVPYSTQSQPLAQFEEDDE